LKVAVFKPAETGCEDLNAPADALALAEAAHCSLPVDTICPYRFAEPLAPAIAAERSNARIDLAYLGDVLQRLVASNDVVVVEGAGGLLVPLSGNVLTVDWVAASGLPAVLVGRLGLGTLNHTLLSARLLRDRGVELLATLLSGTCADESVAAATNEDVLARFAEVRIAGTVPWTPAPGRPDLPPALLQRLLRWAGDSALR